MFRFLLLILCLSSTSLAADDSQALNRQLATINSMHANFNQVVVNAGGTSLQEMTGEMWIQRPEKFVWDSKKPFTQKIISNGELVWIYDEDLEQVVIRNLDHEVSNTPALLLSGDLSQLASNFAVSLTPIDDLEIQYQLIPKNKEAYFESLKITFIADKLVEMFLSDNLGQKTIIEFSSVEMNKKISSDFFIFTPPEGIDVISEIENR